MSDFPQYELFQKLITEASNVVVGEKERVNNEIERISKDGWRESDYASLKRIIIDENNAANLQNQINTINSQVNKTIKNNINLSLFPRINAENSDEQRIQRAIDYLFNNGGGILTNSEELIINDTVVIKDNIDIDFSNCNIISNSSLMPVSFFYVNSKNSKISVNITLTKLQVDNSSRARGIQIADGSENITIEKCNLTNVFYGVYCFNSLVKNIIIDSNNIESIRTDIFFNNVKGETLKIKDNYSIGDKTHTLPIVSQGEIFICGGFDFSSNITNTEYLNTLNNVIIEKNNIKYSNHRPIFVTNCKNVNIRGNYIKGRFGDKNTLGVSDDCIIVDLVDGFFIDGNTVENSGENGIDILSSVNGIVSKNRINNIDDYGIVFDLSDRYVSNKATLDDIYLIPFNVKVENNTFIAKEVCFGVSIGKNIISNSNTFGSGNYTVGTRGYFYILAQTKAKEFILANDTRKIENIKFNGTIKLENKSGIGQVFPGLFVDGSIQLEPSFGIMSDIIPISARQQKAFIHNKGYYNNSIFFVETIPGSDVYIEVKTMLYDGTKLRGLKSYLIDKNQVQFSAGDFLTDNMFNNNTITSANVKVIVY